MIFNMSYTIYYIIHYILYTFVLYTIYYTLYTGYDVPCTSRVYNISYIVYSMDYVEYSITYKIKHMMMYVVIYYKVHSICT